MNISPLAKQFIPLLHKTKTKSKERKDINYDLIMLSLYSDLLEADKYVKNCTIHSETTVIRQGSYDLPNNNRFFPKVIRKYIQERPSSLLSFNCNLKGREINVNYYSFNGDNDRDNDTYSARKLSYTKLVLIWLYICSKYSNKKCAETMDINIYLTPFLKTLPVSNGTVLSAEHINTAFTMCCVPDGEITIYREEEWFKVFIHETFHAYGLDFGLHDSASLLKTMKSVFPIKSDFNPCEAYTETWARIINCALYSFLSMENDKDKGIKASETFLLYVTFCLELERLFAVHQMTKILSFMGLNYKDLYDKREKSAYLRQQLYKEDTHVFAYYVLTAVFLNDYKQFIEWCGETNGVDTNGAVSTNGVVGTNAIGTHIMKFKCNEQSFSKMSEYISNIYNNKELLIVTQRVKTTQQVKTVDKNNNTTRMTVIDVHDQIL